MRLTRLVAAAAAVFALAACETEDTGVTADVTSLYDNYLNKCASCHTPDGAGQHSSIEKTLDFSTVETASKTLREGKASGMSGNQEGCNGMPFVKAGKPGASLLVAVLDETVRQGFDDPDFPDCDGTAISAMDNKVGGAPSAEFLTALKQWITDGAKP